MTLGDVLLFLIMTGLMAWIVRRLTGAKQRAWQRRIDKIQLRTQKQGRLEFISLRRKAAEISALVSWVTKPLPSLDALAEKLARADETISVEQFVFRRIVVVGVVVFVVAGLFKKPFLLALFLGLLVGVWWPLKRISRKITKKQKAFLQLFPDAIDLIVRGLRSGLPVSESIVLVSHELPEPVGGIFGTMNSTMKLGVSLEKALQETAGRLDMTEFNFFTTSIILQRETGGNLAEILNNLSEVLRSRYLMRMKIKAMSSEARASAIIIGALPFVVGVLVMIMSPDYMSVLYTTRGGNIAACIAAGMMTFGLWVMNKMTKFEI